MSTEIITSISQQDVSNWGSLMNKDALERSMSRIGYLGNSAPAVDSSLELAHTAATTAHVFGACVAPLTQLALGPMSLGYAVKHSFPDAIGEYAQASFEEDSEGISLGASKIADQTLFVLSGIGTTACGTIGMMAPEAAAILHYAPVAGAEALLAPLSGAMAGLTLVRGSIILGQGIYESHLTGQFQKRFHTQLKKIDTKNLNATLDQAIKWVEKERYDETGCEKTTFVRRVGQLNLQEPSPQSSLDDKVHFLSEMDKSIYCKKLQEAAKIAIGVAMILGALGVFAGLVFGGPITLSILTLISCALAFGMDGIDKYCGDIENFRKFTDSYYVEPKWLKEAREAIPFQSEASQIEVWFKP